MSLRTKTGKTVVRTESNSYTYPDTIWSVADGTLTVHRPKDDNPAIWMNVAAFAPGKWTMVETKAESKESAT